MKNSKKPFLDKTIEGFGWVGALLLLLAFALSSFSIIQPTSLIYQLLNLVGAIGIIVVSIKKQNYQPATVNVIWLLVALIGIIHIFFT